MLFANSLGNKKRILLSASISTLLISMLVGVQLGGLVSAQFLESVTIKTDGSVEPSNAPIKRNDNIYTLTGDITGALTVERNDCIVNGAGHTVRKLTLKHINNATIVYFSVKNTQRNTEEASEGLIIDDTTNSKVAYNNVSGHDIGIWTSGGSRNVIAGNNVTDNHSHGIFIAGERNTVIGNLIRANGDGVYIYMSRNNSVVGNQILNNSVGIRILFYLNLQTWFILGDPENYIHNNNFGNVQNVINEGRWDDAPMSNTWDDGETGNYWNDYGGEDADGDGVGDSSYVIDSLNRDTYPLMVPVDIPEVSVELPDLPGSPSVVLLNPVNTTYVKASVPLNFVVGEQAAWIGYCLNGQDNVTVMGNITLDGLVNGVHTLKVYANNTYGFTGASVTVTFTVEVFPTAYVIGAIIITVIVVSATLLYYFRKHKH